MRFNVCTCILPLENRSIDCDSIEVDQHGNLLMKKPKPARYGDDGQQMPQEIEIVACFAPRGWFRCTSGY